MTVELAQPHAASKASDSRFKSLHGKSQSQPAVGFQSILSAAADASSEPISTGANLLQAANDGATKDAKDKQHATTWGLQAENSVPNLQNAALDAAPSPVSPEDLAPDTTGYTPATSVAEQVNALLSQSRFSQSNSVNVPQTPVQAQTLTKLVSSPVLTANSPIIQTGQPVVDLESSASVHLPEAPIQSQTFNQSVSAPVLTANSPSIASGQPLDSVFLQNTSANLQQPSAQVPQLSTESESQVVVAPTIASHNVTNQKTSGLAEFDEKNTRKPVTESATQLVDMAETEVAPSAKVEPEISKGKDTNSEPIPMASAQLPLSPIPSVFAPALGSKSSAAESSIASRPVASFKEIVPLVGKETPTTAPSSMPQPLVASLPSQAPIIQGGVSASNQEIKALEVAKVAAIQVSQQTPFARLAAQEVQDRPSRVSGFNEFKPWTPSSFASNSRTSDSSGSSNSKDSSAGTNTSQPATLFAQPMPVDAKFNTWSESNPSNTPVTETVAAPTVVTEREILREEHAVFKTNQPDVVPDLQTYAPTGSDNSFTLPKAEGAVPMETYVAEQVTYWISQDVQNAELKLEGIGVDPVQVNITMQGNEAFVTFTTDEQQAREALENARQQLQEMLQSQGVTLSGLSVGSNNAGNSGSQDRNSRQGNKQTVVASVEPQIQENRPRVGRTSGSALDLFV